MCLFSHLKIKRENTIFIVYNCHKNKNPSELLTGIKTKTKPNIANLQEVSYVFKDGRFFLTSLMCLWLDQSYFGLFGEIDRHSKVGYHQDIP